MVNEVTWAGEAKKFYENNKGKNGINTFGDALKSPELKKQYKLAKKQHKLPKKRGNNELVMDGGIGEGDEEEPVMDGGLGDEQLMDRGVGEGEKPLMYRGDEQPVMDGGFEEGEEPEITGGKKRKTTKKSKKAKKTVKKRKTAKKQKKVY